MGGDPHNDLSQWMHAVDTVGGHRDAMDAVGAVYIVDTMDTGMQWTQ